MDGGKNENISLLDTGGGTAELIPVQGGGGSSGGGSSGGGSIAYNESVSLLDTGGGTNTVELLPVQGGGQVADLTGLFTSAAPGSGSAIAAAQTDPLGTLFSTLPLMDQIDTIKQAVATQMVGTQAGLNNDQIAEIIVNSTLSKTQDSIRAKYGIPHYDVDPTTQAAIDTGSAGEQQAARDAVAKYDADPSNHNKTQHEQVEEKSAAVFAATMAYREDAKNRGLLVPIQRTKLKGKVIEFKTKLIEKINHLKGVDINRIEYTVKGEGILDIVQYKDYNSNLQSWMAGLSRQITKFFPAIVKQHIEIHRHDWTQALIQTRMKTEYPVVFEQDLPSIATDLANNKFTRSDYYTRYVVSLPYTMKLIVTIPPMKGDIQLFIETLTTLQALNLIKYVRGDEKNRWQVAKDAVLVFSHPFYDYSKGKSDRVGINRMLFVCMNELEMENRHRVFCLSDGGSADLVRVGLYDICNCDNPDSTKRIKSKSGIEYVIPTLLSPTHVLFPYKLNAMNGILISGEVESEAGAFLNEPNPFTTIYRSALYGKLFGLSIKKGYPISVADPTICAIRMDQALTRFLKDTTPVVGDPTAIIAAHVKPLLNKILDFCSTNGIQTAGLDQAILAIATANPQVGRGEFIVQTEAIIKIKRGSVKVIEAITTDPIKATGLQKILADYPIKDYDKYLRFPFSDEVKHIQATASSVQTGGGDVNCESLRIPDRMRPLKLFDKELYIIHDIIILNLRNDYNKCLPEIKNEQFGPKEGLMFIKHKEVNEIYNKYDTTMIEVGGRMFEIRRDSMGVSDNWGGLIAPDQIGEAGVVKKENDAPILIQGEADLLNSLQLTPQNMGAIFNENNKYNLTNWRNVIPSFFRNLLASKCYKDTVLLTNAECQTSRNFLYSIQEYVESPEHIESAIEQEVLVKEDLTEKDEDLLLGDIGTTDGVIELNVVRKHDPTYEKHMVNGKYYPSVKAIAVHKKSGNEIMLAVYLKSVEISENDIITDEHKSSLLLRVKGLQAQYPNYVIYTY